MSQSEFDVTTSTYDPTGENRTSFLYSGTKSLVEGHFWGIRRGYKMQILNGDLLSGPVTAVESAVLDGLGQMSDGKAWRAFEIGYGSGDFEYAVVGAGGQALLLHGAFQ